MVYYMVSLFEWFFSGIKKHNKSIKNPCLITTMLKELCSCLEFRS